jgi:hypothetical protein
MVAAYMHVKDPDSWLDQGHHYAQRASQAPLAGATR